MWGARPSMRYFPALRGIPSAGSVQIFYWEDFIEQILLSRIHQVDSSIQHCDTSIVSIVLFPLSPDGGIVTVATRPCDCFGGHGRRDAHGHCNNRGRWPVYTSHSNCKLTGSEFLPRIPLHLVRSRSWVWCMDSFLHKPRIVILCTFHRVSFILWILLCGFHRVDFIVLSCRFHCADSTMQISSFHRAVLSCGIYCANSIVWIPLYQFYQADSIMCFPLYVFHHLHSIVCILAD